MKDITLNTKMFSYFEVFLKQSFAFRMEALANAAFNVAFPVTMIIVWSAVYYTTGTVAISGFTLPQLYAYFFALTLSDAFVMYGVAWAVEYDVNSGQIYTYLTKPLSYMATMLANQLAGLGFYLSTAGIVVAAIFTMFVHVPITALTLVLFVAELGVSFVISFCIMYMMGCVAFYVPAIEGIVDVSQFIMMFLGGGLVPIAMFPSWASGAMYVLPFQYFYNLPASTLAGMIPAGQAIYEIAVGIGWAVLLSVACMLVWNKAKLRMDAVGV